MEIWGNPAATKKKFSTHLGGAPAPGAPPAYATGVSGGVKLSVPLKRMSGAEPQCITQRS